MVSEDVKGPGFQNSGRRRHLIALPTMISKPWATRSFTSGSRDNAPAPQIAPEVIENRKENSQASRFPWQSETFRSWLLQTNSEDMWQLISEGKRIDEGSG